MTKTLLFNLFLLSITIVYSCKCDKPQLIAADLNVINEKDHILYGHMFRGTINLPEDFKMDSIKFVNNTHHFEFEESTNSVSFSYTPTARGITKLRGKIYGKSENGVNVFNFFTAFGVYKPVLEISGEFLVRNYPNRLNINQYIGERLDSIVVKMENAIFEKSGINNFIVYPGKDSIVKISVFDNEKNWLGTMDFKVHDEK